MPTIVSVASRFPERYARQEDVAREFQRVAGGRGDATPERIARFFRNVGVAGRHMVLPIEDYPHLGGFAERSQIWLRHALDLGAAATDAALARAGLARGDIALFATSTVTGITVPSLDARLMATGGFAPTCRRMPFFGLGCVAGAAGLARVNDYLEAHPDEAALLLCVELCSLTFQLTDASVANIIASALFGDGAAAVVLVGDRHPLASRPGTPRIRATQSVFFPGTERTMGWDIIDTGFRVVLSGSVPDLARGPFADAARAFLGGRHLAPRDITSWFAHPGGPAVIDAVEDGLALARGTLDSSRRSLERMGNLSSASVLVLLEEAMVGDTPPRGPSVLFAMGPGFCAEMIHLEW